MIGAPLIPSENGGFGCETLNEGILLCAEDSRDPEISKAASS